jgi:NAD(P)-dependent dehydrogenase (short-subunit alcohol dehydrogenase family)
MKNLTALITGANSGIGLETAKALALANFDLIIIVRSQAKADECITAIKQVKPNALIDAYIADLNNLDAMKNTALAISKKYAVIDRLICNAGFGPNVIEFTSSGLEKSFVTNHLGHFVLVNMLRNQIEASRDGRIINVASSAYKLGKVARMFVTNNTSMNALQAYADGKLANVLFTKALALKFKNVKSFSLHPGVVKSGFGANYTGLFKLMAMLMRPFMRSAVNGAQTNIYLATTDLKNIASNNGDYFEKSKAVSTQGTEVTDDNAEWLWNKSMEAVG